MVLCRTRVIDACEGAGCLNRQDVMRLFDHANLRCGHDAGRGNREHNSPSLMLLHSAQTPRLSLTSSIACASRGS